MDKRQSDHIEQRIREAAESMSPPPDDKGWQKMELLLDQEFSKKRRRGFIWWWRTGLFGCLAIGASLLLYWNGTPERTGRAIQLQNKITSGKISTGSPQKEQSLSPDTKISGKADNRVPGNNINDNSNASRLPGTVADKPAGKNPTQDIPVSSINKAASGNNTRKPLTAFHQQSAGKVDGSSNSGNPKSSLNTKGISGYDLIKSQKNSPIKFERASDTKESKIGREAGEMPLRSGSGTSANTTNGQSIPVGNESRRQTTADSTSGSQPGSATGKGDSASRNLTYAPRTDTASDATGVRKKAPSGKIKLKALPNRYAPGVYFLASYGTVSTRIGKLDVNDRRPVYGFGAGYRFSNRLSIQAGLYAGRKIYTAGPGEYKTSPDSYISRYKVLKVDADCMIYELPLLARYDIIARSGFRVYAALGLSSYIMKRESYKYHLTGSMGYLQKDSTYTNNKNLFSSAAISIGVEQKLMRTLFIQAEPYVRLPFSGVGEGKVQLYSAGLQFSLRYQPVWKGKK